MTTPPSSSDRFEELRKLLLQGEQERIQQLENVLFDEAGQSRHLGKHLSQALRIAAEDQTRLVEALREPTLESIAVSAQCDRERVANALAPVIRPAIQRAIVEALQSFLQSVDDITQRSLSLDGLRWRWEAKRTGMPFQQVVLNHTLRYVVEQVYLIQKPGGLLAAHLVHPDIKTSDVDKDAVAAMLMAIQGFVRDSAFADSSERLETIELHGKTVWLCHGPWALVACVIRGVPAAPLRTEIQQSLDEVHKGYHHALRDFDGNPDNLTDLTPLLSRLLKKETIADHKEGSRRFGAASTVLLGGLVAWLTYAVYHGFQHRAEELRLRSVLSDTPSAVVTDLRREGKIWRVHGLLDPLAADANIAARAQLPPERLELALAPYLSMDRQLSMRRISQALHPPAGVTLASDGVSIKVQGKASQRWIDETKRLLAVLPLGDSVDWSEVIGTDLPTPPRLSDLLTAIDAIKLYFSEDTTLLADSEPRLDDLRVRLRQLAEAARAAGLRVQLLITGQVDGLGPEAANKSLKQERANSIKARLLDVGLADNDIISAPGDEKVIGLDNNQRRVDLLAKLLPQ